MISLFYYCIQTDMRGGKSYAPNRFTRSSAMHNPSPHMDEESSPLEPVINNETSNTNESMLHENLSLPLSSSSEPNHESITTQPITSANATTQPINTNPTSSKHVIEIRNNRYVV